jgi:16S rRNA U516 pseudouridylate synthase RsuA-like enzyme
LEDKAFPKNLCHFSVEEINLLKKQLKSNNKVVSILSKEALNVTASSDDDEEHIVEDTLPKHTKASDQLLK